MSAAPADGTNMGLSRENLPDEDRFGDSVQLLDAIGAGIKTSYKNVRLGSAALAGAGIEPRGLSTLSFRISWLLRDAAINNSVRALHRVFIEEAAIHCRERRKCRGAVFSGCKNLPSRPPPRKRSERGRASGSEDV